jgi:hypothetical protein
VRLAVRAQKRVGVTRQRAHSTDRGALDSPRLRAGLHPAGRVHGVSQEREPAREVAQQQTAGDWSESISSEILNFEEV